MKKPTSPMLWVLGLSVIAFTSSCEYDQEEHPKINQIDSPSNPSLLEHQISLDTVELLMNSVKFTNTEQSIGRDYELGVKDIKDIKPVNDENGQLLFYITNFENGGFVILSGDNRVSPVLAFSEDDTFDTNGESYPTGLVEWLVAVKDSIQLVRKLDVRQTEVTKSEWENLSLERFFEAKEKSTLSAKLETPFDPNYCQDQYYTKSPLLSTAWSQGCGYNDFLPVKPCTEECNRVYAGCVPIAIAQVLRYHESPATYNWAAMSDNTGSLNTSLLIKDIHNIINPINYYCDGTGVNKDYNTAGLFTSNFGYSKAKQSSLNRNTVIQEIKWANPVILAGGKNNGWWIFNNYGDGHMWVCDGYKKSKTCNYSEGNYIGFSIYEYFHMNWGWGPSSYNGWFSMYNFNPGSKSYNYKNKMVYNIRP